MTESKQNLIDEFYLANGPCCAGCDHWRWLNTVAGECHKSAPVGGQDRFTATGMELISARVASGHIVTERSYHCGDFVDTHDWGKGVTAIEEENEPS